MEGQHYEFLYSLCQYMAEHTGDNAWISADPMLLEAYLPTGWDKDLGGDAIVCCAEALETDGITAQHCKEAT